MRVTAGTRSFASRYPTAFLRTYVRWKLAVEPAYEEVYRNIGDSRATVIDLGCGIGLLPMYLRHRGFTGPIVGIDHDEAKIEVARRANPEAETTFVAADVRAPIAMKGNVVLLDVLHYFRDEDQRAILGNAADAARGEDMVLIRDGIKDGSFRYKLVLLEETFATRNGWLKAERLNFPTAEAIVAGVGAGFLTEKKRLSGPLPLNNFFFAFRKSGAP